MLQQKVDFSRDAPATFVCINHRCPDYFEPALRIHGTGDNDKVEIHPLTVLPTQEEANKGSYGRAPTYCQRKECGEKQELGDGVWACRTHNPEMFKEAKLPGVKIDTGKPPVYTEFLMQFPLSIRMIALVGDAGSKAAGHVRSGWKEVERGHERYSNAMGRHLLDEAQLLASSDVDTSDPMRDLIWQAATVAWNDLARLEHLIRENRAAAERLDTTREA